MKDIVEASGYLKHKQIGLGGVENIYFLEGMRKRFH